MTAAFAIKPATRQGFKPLIGLYAESGCGKTYSALLLARGLVGPTGKIVLVDTESGRGSLYADVIPGGYQTIDFPEPFTPQRFRDVLTVVEDSEADVVIIDSGSHEWEGVGGVLDWAGENEKRGMKGRLIWKEPKMEHEKFVGKLTQTRLPVIVCLRAKHLLIEGKDPDTGRKTMTKDVNCTPKQAEDFIYMMTAHAEILPDHSLRMTKISHPTLGACFPAKGPITIETGEKLAKWCASAGAGASTNPAPPTTTPGFKKLKAELWDLTALKHQGNPRGLIQWLWDENVVPFDRTLESITEAELPEVIARARKKLA
jgi:hypothetical protein